MATLAIAFAAVAHAHAAVAGAVGPAEPVAPVCPAGSGPAEVGELTHDARSMSLDVSNAGYGVLTVRDIWVNAGSGHGEGTLSFSADGFIKAARVGPEGKPLRAAKLDDVDAASASFDAYRAALEYGVDPGEGVKGRALPAVLVEHETETSVTVGVLAPCPVRRIVVELDVVVPSVPVDGAWLLRVPRPTGDEQVPFVVDTSFPARISVDGGPIRRGASFTNVRGSASDADGDGAVDPLPDVEASESYVLVRPLAGPKLRTRGFAARIAPLEAPPLPSDDDEDAPAPAPSPSPSPSPSEAEAAAEPPEPVQPVVIARAELDLPRPLAEAPAGLRIVFVVDASVSMGEQGLAAAVHVVDGILSEAPVDARFAVVAAARKPYVVVAPWSARGERDELLASPKLALANGSDVAAGIAKARAIAADVGEGEVARVIVVSDMQMAFAVDDAALASSFGDAPLAHAIAIPDWLDVEEPFTWARQFGDDDARALGPERTGGIWVDLSGGDDGEGALFAHLIRPTRIDQPRVTLAGVDVLAPPEPPADTDAGAGGPIAQVIVDSPRDREGIERGEGGLPVYLVEGSGLRVEVALPGDRAVRDLRVQGWLWAARFNERVVEDRSLMGLAAAGTLSSSLDDAIVRRIARQSHAVSRVTSLVEVPQFRPERTDELLGLRGYGCSCGCGGCRCGMGGSGRTIGCAGAPVDLRERETLERLLAEDARACLVPRAVLEVEFGDLEILAITEREGGVCVSERFWQRRLDKLVDKHPRAFVGHHEITVGADLHAG